MNEKMLRERSHAFDYLFDAVVVTDLEGDIIDWNAGSEKLYGYTKEEAIGQTVSILHVPEDIEHVTKEVLAAVAKDGKWTGEVRMLRKDGTIGWIESMVVPFADENGQPMGALGINRDITDRMERERKLILQSGLVQKGEMISMIAHQWRQPLSAISAVSSDISLRILSNKLLCDTPEAIEQAHDYLLNSVDKIEHLVQDLSETIQGFRDFFKPKKDKSRFSLQTIVEHVLETLEALIEIKQIEVVTKFESDSMVQSYEFELTQVVINILKNAIDVFDESTKVEPKVGIVIKNSENNLILVISDNGPKIPTENLDKIFDPYFSTKKKNGTGLGLYMSKMIIEDHCKGRLTVINTDEGVEFTIRLPFDID